MIHTLRGPLLLAALAGLFLPHAGFSQSTSPADSADETIPAPPRILKAPPSETPSAFPSSPATGTLPPAPILLPGDPTLGTGPGAFPNALLGPPGQSAGWYANIEGGLVKPHINSHLNGASSLEGRRISSTTLANPAPRGPESGSTVLLFGDHITLPVAPLNWTGSPRIRLGYRLPNGAGDLRLEWSMVASQGMDTLPNFDAAGAGSLKSRLNVQYASFTYGTSEFLTNAPNINRTWGARFGLAAGNVFFDSQAHGQQILEQSASNSFAGLGPTLLLSAYKPIAHSPVSLYGRIDGTGLVGDTRQHFSETIANGGQPLTQSFSLGKQSNAVGIFGVEGGLSYAPWNDRNWRFTLGYQWQRWWWVGASDISNADLTLQGLFFRGEWRY
jgi:hypothetical protein